MTFERSPERWFLLRAVGCVHDRHLCGIVPLVRWLGHDTEFGRETGREARSINEITWLVFNLSLNQGSPSHPMGCLVWKPMVVRYRVDRDEPPEIPGWVPSCRSGSGPGRPHPWTRKNRATTRGKEVAATKR